MTILQENLIKIENCIRSNPQYAPWSRLTTPELNILIHQFTYIPNTSKTQTDDEYQNYLIGYFINQLVKKKVLRRIGRGVFKLLPKE